MEADYARVNPAQGPTADTAAPASGQNGGTSAAPDAGLPSTPSISAPYSSSAGLGPLGPTGPAPGGMGARPRSGWDVAQDSYTQGHTLELRVVGYNRGGLLVDLGDVRGFVPASQLVQFPRRLTEEERLNELARFVGRALRLKVIELDRIHNRLILSERVASLPPPRTDQVINTLEPGQVCRGVVRNVTDFGAFVDLGGIEGLIHVSEMSWQRVSHPSDVCAPGQEIQVYVMNVNREQRRVALSIKRLSADPWSLVAQHYKAGDFVEVLITNVVSFGAFAKLPEGVEGLIHASELAEGSFLHPRNVVHEGQMVQARVTHIDAPRQRIGLSLRPDSVPINPDTLFTTEPPDANYWNSLAREM